MSSKHSYQSIAVLMGGWSNERDISRSTGLEILNALKDTSYTVTGIDVEKNLPKLLSDIAHAKPDVIINALHGTGGEDGVIQGVLTMLGIPFTHSGVLPSAVAMDKIMSRAIFQSVGIPMAPCCVINQKEYARNADHPFAFPYVIKPIAEGSSRGVSIIRSDLDKKDAMALWTFGDNILAEQYIPGREINVAVINGKAIGAIELKPKSGFYDYEAKYTEGKTDHIMPAPLSALDQEKMFTYAEKAFQVLGCKGVTRADFRLDESKDAPYPMVMLELNTQPGMTSLSLVPEIAAYYKMSFLDLIECMLDCAITTAH